MFGSEKKVKQRLKGGEGIKKHSKTRLKMGNKIKRGKQNDYFHNVKDHAKN